jgi:hypothetical protein
MSLLTATITATDPAVRNRSLDELCAGRSTRELLTECDALDHFRRHSDNLYERVRALFFLYSIHRFHLPQRFSNSQCSTDNSQNPGRIPFHGYEQLLRRRFEEAIDTFLAEQGKTGPSDALSSALATAFHRLAFQTLANQVRRSVRTVRGNQWMFRMGHPADQPLRIRPELLKKSTGSEDSYPILRESTPVRMDLTHCGWSDIFFLGMDYPEGAKVLNISIDLGVHGRDSSPRPPVEAYLRVIEEPLLRLVSVDLGAAADISDLSEVFDFAKDYLGLLKAAVIASGIIPPGIEGSGQSLAEVLARVVGTGRGIELVSSVNNIPKGSRLAVSTNLLAALISVCMRATGQAASLTGGLQEHERRLVLARALLGEWLGGSGGGWQDSGGVWPGMKLIEGVAAAGGDPELGISRGRLMPKHSILGEEDASAETRRKLQDSLVLVHGGMAQNVGPILEMVTEKYLLRSPAEWQARQNTLGILNQILAGLKKGDVGEIGNATTRNFEGPIQQIIPWATNLFTETLIRRAHEEFGKDFWGFWMLGGMSGGGMGFIFAPHRKAEAQKRLQEIMSSSRQQLQHALPFAMEPVVYDFAINENGTTAEILLGSNMLMPAGYYTLILPALIRQDQRSLSSLRRAELDRFGAACRSRPELRGVVQTLFDALLPKGKFEAAGGQDIWALLDKHGFDKVQHERIRADIKEGRIGLAQNRLPTNAAMRDADASDITDARSWADDSKDTSHLFDLGARCLKNGEVAVVTLAAGAGSRWTQGAGVVKALNPFCKFKSIHRSFLETHLAKSRRVSRQFGSPVPHVFTTGYLTHQPTAEFLAAHRNYGYEGDVILSEGKSVGLRMVPALRDLHFMWQEMPQQMLDEQQQKIRDSLRHALAGWAKSAGEGSDYTDNLPIQCMHPVGHWYEVPNMLRNGTLGEMLRKRPQLKHLLLHNIDTLGATLDPSLLGRHIETGACLSFEVITRRLEDRGGGLARVNGQLRLVEGLAMPREETEFEISYYNSNSCWIDIDKLLSVFGLSRTDLIGGASGPASRPHEKIDEAIRNVATKMPTYITLKDVKKRWGHGQEDVFPVAQFEKLWVDMTALPEVDSRFMVVPRIRGQQLKDPAQLDGWLRDGSAAWVDNLCDWD